jgi:hypothetical protein
LGKGPPYQKGRIMHRRTLLKTSLGGALALILGTQAGADQMDETTQASFDTVMAFMGAMGSGDMETMNALMADDMVSGTMRATKACRGSVRGTAKRQS